jgi:cellulose biosynthesis protein BcsQ
MMMDNEISNTQDIARLCEVLGLHPSAFVAFERDSIEHRKPALGQQNHHVVERPLPRIDGVRPRPHLPIANSALDSISPELLNQSGIGARRQAPELAQRKRTTFKPTQIALLSISGGSGKTTLAAILSRILSGRGHSVLLADHSPINTIRDLFRLRRDPSTAVSFLTGSRLTSPLPVISRFNDGSALEDFDSWFPLIAARTHFTFLDGMSNAVNAGRDLAKRGARILVPVLPDLVSAMSAMRFDRTVDSPRPSQVNYLLNRFDHANAVHLDVKGWLRENLGARLLPFEIPESVSVSQVAAGTLATAHLSDHSTPGRVMELLADWLEKTCAAEETAKAEVNRGVL